MKRLLCAIAICILLCQSAIAAGAVRYKDRVFHEIKIDSVAYCSHDGIQLYMDVYQPVGDTAAQRPLVILAHGGSFMHGNRRSECISAICRELAMRGFVAVSIDYRLSDLLHMASKRNAYRSIIKAVADGRNSVRWFVRNVAQGNTYHINPGRIFFGGNSAGAILAEQLAFIDSAAMCPPMLCNAVKKYMPDTGALPPHTIHGIISLAGAVLDTNLISPGQPSILHIQGDADKVVPYGRKHPIHGLAPFSLAGLGASRPRYISQHLDFTEYVLAKAGHTPWDRDKELLTVVIGQMVDFLNKEMK